jgi:hypothetical protein
MVNGIGMGLGGTLHDPAAKVLFKLLPITEALKQLVELNVYTYRGHIKFFIFDKDISI